MNADRGTAYCCGQLMRPTTNGYGGQGDTCWPCGRYTPTARVIMPTTPCEVCGAPTTALNAKWCERHRDRRKRVNYQLRVELGLPTNTTGGIGGHGTLRDRVAARVGGESR